MRMKLCGGTRKMTQRRSSILLAIAVLMIVVVESLTLNTHELENIADTERGNNETNSYLDIKLNLIDSDLKEETNQVQEITTTEHSVTDIGLEYENTTVLNYKNHLNDLQENKENMVKNEDPVNEVFESEIQKINETKEEINSDSTTAQLETTTATLSDETTLVQNNEKLSNNDDAIPDVDSLGREEQPQTIEVPDDTRKHYSDLSIYFEDEPSQTRQLRNFNEETDNEVSNSDESESGSDSNDSKSLELEISSPSDAPVSRDENKGLENSSISKSLSNEKYNADSKPETLESIPVEYPNKTMEEDSVKEIESVTESAGEVTNHVTTVSSEEIPTVMKKPSVDKISQKNQSMEENSNNIATSTQGPVLDSVINLVLNRSKGEEEASSNSLTKSTSSVQSLSKQFDDVVNETSNSKEALSEAFENKLKTEDNNNSIDINVEDVPDQQNNVFESNQSSLKPFYENNSSSLNNKLTSASNDIHSSEIHDNKVLEVNLLKNDNETLMQIPLNKHNEKLLLFNTKEQQTENIFESTTEPSIIIDSIIETSTEEDNESIIQTHEEYQMKTVTDNTTVADSLSSTTVKNLLNNEVVANSAEKSSSEIHPVLQSETTVFSEEHSEISTQSITTNRYEPELLEKEQTGNINKINNEIFKEKPNILFNHTTESLPEFKLFETILETSTEKATININDNPATLTSDKKEFGTTSDYAQHVDSLQTMRDESSSVVSNEVIAPASVGRSFNEFVAEGLGKPLPTRSVGDEPSSSSYSSEDKTTTVIVLCAAAGGIFVAFSLAIYLISFQRQHGTLDIEMQEQKCGKDNLDDDDDSETRVSLLNQIPTIESDEHSSD